MRSKWLSRKEKSFWVCEFSGYGADRQALAAEIQAAQAIISRQAHRSLLVAIDLYDADMTPELAAFFQVSSAPTHSPIRKMAIIGVSGVRRIWYQITQHVTWPKQAAFFDDWEQAKDWLVSEGF